MNEVKMNKWKSLNNQQDLSIFFADPGCPSQRGLNEHSNGLLNHFTKRSF